jgi:hypothetical protein
LVNPVTIIPVASPVQHFSCGPNAILKGVTIH